VPAAAPAWGGQSVPSPEVSATPTLLALQINFTADGTTIPPGFIDDTGLVYQLQNGYSFGWNQDNTKNMRDKDSSNSPNEQEDTFALMQASTNSNASWSISVPNGTYSVSMTAGDPTSINGNYEMDVNGVLAVSGIPTGKNHWISGTVTLTVTNDQLLVTNASGAVNNKLDFITITQLSNAPGPNLGSADPASVISAMKASVTGSAADQPVPNQTTPSKPANLDEALMAAAVPARATSFTIGPDFLPNHANQPWPLGTDLIDAVLADSNWPGLLLGWEG
jgi:hypothetical protein